MQRNAAVLLFGRRPYPSIPFETIKTAILGTRYELSVFFAPPKEAQRINIAYRGKSYIPNTLSFALSKTSGEIILCRSAARKEHAKFDLEYENYLIFLFIHSCLHLKGYAHGGTMEQLEAKFLARFKKR
jgi:probable rRNA maturation factor